MLYTIDNTLDTSDTVGNINTSYSTSRTKRVTVVVQPVSSTPATVVEATKRKSSVRQARWPRQSGLKQQQQTSAASAFGSRGEDSFIISQRRLWHFDEAPNTKRHQNCQYSYVHFITLYTLFLLLHVRGREPYLISRLHADDKITERRRDGGASKCNGQGRP